MSYCATVAATLLFAVAVYTHHMEPVTGSLTAIALLAAIKLHGLCIWLSNRPIQYLGRISYSLYLTHALVLQIVTSIFLRVRIASTLYSIPAYIFMLAVPIMTAEIFYRIIEKPSHRWAMNFSRPQQDRLPATPMAEVVSHKVKRMLEPRIAQHGRGIS